MPLTNLYIDDTYDQVLYQDAPNSIKRGDDGSLTGFTAGHFLSVKSGGAAFEDSGKAVPTGDVVGTSDTQTLTNKTLTTPVIASFYQDAGKTKLLTAPALSGTIVLSTAALSLAEVNVLDDAVAGTIVASKAVVVDASKDVSEFRKVGLAYADFANQTSLQSTITTDKSRLYFYDDGSTVHLMATKDDNATETQVKLAEQSSITNLSSQGAAYFGNGTDQYLYIPDNANLRFGTGNFALIFKNLRLPDYTPSAAVTLARKANTTDYLGWIFTVETDGKPQIAFGNGANFTTLAYKSSVAIDATDATTIHLIAVVTRETASVAGSVNFYQFGYNTWKLLSSVAITAGTPQTVTETTPSSLVLFQNIDGTTEYAFQSFGGFYPCNFAPTYAEVKEIVEKGVPYKYKGASQTELTANGDLTAWTGSLPDYYGTSANGTGGTWSNTKVDNGDATYSWMVTKTNSTGYVWICKRSAVGEGGAATACVVGKSYWLKLRYKCDSGGWQNSSLGLTAIIADGAEHTINEKFVNPSPYIPFIQLTTDTKYFQVYEWEINPVGCVAEYLPEGVGNYTWFDNSINAIHGTVNGATPVGLPPNDIQTAVKIGIANTATALSGIVPAGYYIKQIRAKGSTSLSGVKIGTSSGGEQVVASTSVGTTPTLLTLASTANAAYSESAATTLYAQHGTAGATLDLYLVLERIK